MDIMKNFLVIGLLATSVVLLADEPAEEIIVGASSYEIGTYQVHADQNVTNVLIPVCFKSLSHYGEGSDAIPLAEIMKVSNLTTGDQIIRFNGSGYNAWSFDGASWFAADTINVQSLSIDTGDDASKTTLITGEALWLIRNDPSLPTTGIDIQLFGKYVDSAAMTTTIARASWNFIANPTGADVDGMALETALANLKSGGAVVGPQNGDKILMISNSGYGKAYAYSTSKNGWVAGLTKTTLPAIGRLNGFWYFANKGSGSATFVWPTSK